MTHITKHLEDLKQRICDAARTAGRSENDVSILAVSKRHPVEAIKAAAAAGLLDMGENYLQEALGKIPQFSTDITWHYIGRIQSNKTRDIAHNFQWVHTIDSERAARRLSEQRPDHLPPMNACIQICTDATHDHGGITPEAAAALCDFIEQQPGLKLRGLMAIPAATNDKRAQSEAFARLHTAQIELREFAPGLDTLSMGMSGDMESAIAQGSTLVRIGTDIFGARKK